MDEEGMRIILRKTHMFLIFLVKIMGLQRRKKAIIG